MDPKMQEIFAPVKAVLESQEMSLADFMEIVGGFAVTDPTISHAMCMHARDIDTEGEADSYATLICEVYRRTFFDREHAAKYGTTSMLDAGDDVLPKFATHLLECLSMDATQDATGSKHAAAPGSH